MTEEFLEFISDGALAIEVWGHRCAGNGRSLWELDALEAKTQTLRDRYEHYLHEMETDTHSQHAEYSHIINLCCCAFKVERGISQD